VEAAAPGTPVAQDRDLSALRGELAGVRTELAALRLLVERLEGRHRAAEPGHAVASPSMQRGLEPSASRRTEPAPTSSDSAIC
jgi:hypothetical protein